MADWLVAATVLKSVVLLEVALAIDWEEPKDMNWAESSALTVRKKAGSSGVGSVA